MASDQIIIKGARQHNLKNVNLELPRNKLIVFTGLSGSGKSSLAFDTIYAEGQRRYVESLSAYARQFLGQMEKPDVDLIEGLSPAISIEQKTTSHNPRSTVGTVTEIYDYLRVLFARCGETSCYICGRQLKSLAVDEMIELILGWGEGTKIQILSPIVRDRKGEYKKELEQLKKDGYQRVRLDGEIVDLDSDITMDKKRKHDIDVILDRIVIKEGVRERLADLLEAALKLANGIVRIIHQAKGAPEKEELLSEHLACPEHPDVSIAEMHPRLFSFNTPHGACPSCHGLGEKMEFDPDMIIPDPNLSIDEGAIASIKMKPGDAEGGWWRSILNGISEHFKVDLTKPWKKLTPAQQKIVLHGNNDEEIKLHYVNKDGKGKGVFYHRWEGIIPGLDRRYKETMSDDMKGYYEKFMSTILCDECSGNRLRKESLAVRVEAKNIVEICNFTVKQGVDFFEQLKFDDYRQTVADKILKEIRSRLGFLKSVGLGYLNLWRKTGTLSGGESQRIRLATQIGSQLVGVLYVLDEPTIGLHQRDNQRLIDSLIHLRDIGNTVVVVEHDEQVMESSDYIVDLGPGAGVHGGNVIFAGKPADLKTYTKSITGQYLSGQTSVAVPKSRKPGNGESIYLVGGRKNNLKNISVEIPLGKLIAITGVSGSGKSTLINDLLIPSLKATLDGKPVHHQFLTKVEGSGLKAIDKMIVIDQSPIGRTPRSNPATYTGLFTPLRDLFAALSEAKLRGYSPGRFSFNVKGGRCETCQGDGMIKIEMHFMPDVYVTCDTCRGKRYNTETLQVKFKDLSISDVLHLTIAEARQTFASVPSIYNKLEKLDEVGLGYIQLGQSATTLSGGEAQRVKLATELAKRATGRTFYFLDEPTTGLHFDDVRKLIEVLQRFVNEGNTVLVIEHNLDVIKVCDYIIDLGPEGGDEGGELIFQGTPEQLVKIKKSYTGQYLGPLLAGKRGK